jgi:uncharacterized protein YlaI
MDIADLNANHQMREYFAGLARPCPASWCDGFLTEFDQVSMKPFKAFLVCPACESRIAVVKRGEWENRERITVSPLTAG